MGHDKNGIKCLTPVKTLSAVRDDSWAKALCSGEATLALKLGSFPGGD